jgi:cell division protein FtsI/penicillin-binding protein 2
MDPLKSAAANVILIPPLFLLLITAGSMRVANATSAASQQVLFTQSLRQSLERQFHSNTDISYLLIDADSTELLAANWPNLDNPIPPGSLVKPFTALAYAASHNFRYPRYECRGKSAGCWQPQPHGKLDISSAISVSCNSYFRQLAQNIDVDQVRTVTDTYGLEPPPPNSPSTALVGISDDWKISPIHLAHAYLELARRSNQPGVGAILEGMRQSALRGTGAAFGSAISPSTALVKTGTAPCTHSPSAPADGFVMAMLPADKPQVLLLLRVHGKTGAKAAEAASAALRSAKP